MADDADAPGDGELSESTTPTAGDSVDPESMATEARTTAGAAEEADLKDYPENADESATAGGKRRGSDVRLALVVGLVMVVALAGLVGWLGYRGYQSHQAKAQRQLFVQVGRQAALNLTTINFQEVDADVRRILDSSTGAFYDDFQKRSQPFVDVVKQAQSKSEGTVTEAGLESEQNNEAQVLVAVTVKTSNAGAAEQQPRAWRMRINVQKVGDGAKVSNVEFVP
jgi:Mce-associated membrane protein